ncbi:MAG: 50S ribosomal protein L4 [Lentisphaeraceae bacterium]|nr:50S ribosomal protein L4 [Lentisphaeraceae bacterium]
MNNKIQVLDKQGSTTEEFEVQAQWIEREKGEQAVHEAVVAYLAGLRAGTACTKTRSEVRGGGKKPYKQKGTGRARAGSTRSPIWRGGGITFGPKPRSYKQNLNKKAKRLAVRRALAERLDAGQIVVVEDFTFDAPKTKLAAAFLKNINAANRPVVILDDSIMDDAKNNTYLAFRNVAGCSIIGAAWVNAYILLSGQKIVITKTALQQLGERIAKED